VNVQELQELLHRCEREDATKADLERLAALLQEQERREGWGLIRSGLRAGLDDEIAAAAPAELAQPVLERVGLPADGLVPQAMALLSEELLRMGDRVDVASDVLRLSSLGQAVPGEALAALRGGLSHESTRVDLAESVMHFVAPSPDALLDEHMAALAQGLERAAQLPASFTTGVMDAVQPQRDRSLDQAMALLGAELAARAASFDHAETIMGRIEAQQAWELELCAMADGELSRDAKRAVAARLADDPAARQRITAYASLGREVRRALAAEVAGHDLSAIWPAVEAELGLGELAAWRSLAAGIQAEAGEIDVADLVMDSIAPPVREPEPAVAAAVDPVAEPLSVAQPSRVERRWSWRVPLLGLAASAAAMLFVVQVVSPDSPGAVVDPGPQPALADAVFQISDTNTIEIEQLEVAEDAMVQVFQLEDGAPMVIFIDEGLEPDSVEG
jgi:hypothetical protein